MLTFVVKDDTPKEKVEESIRMHYSEEYEILTESELKERGVSIDALECPPEIPVYVWNSGCPPVGMEDLTGWAEEMRRKEIKTKKEQEKWRRKFSNRK